MKSNVQTKRLPWWRVPLLFLVCLLGGSGGVSAATNFVDRFGIKTHPSAATPYITVTMVFYDTNGNDSFFMHTAGDGSHDGPAVYVDDYYICSPNWELAWPGGDNAGNGTGAGNQMSYDEWWGSAYRKTINGIEYLVRFWNPWEVESGRYAVHMCVYISRMEIGSTHSVKIKGYWKTNNVGTVLVDQKLTTNAVPCPWGNTAPTATMANYNTVSVSGPLASSYGPTTVGFYRNAPGTAPGGYVAKGDANLHSQDFGSGNANFSGLTGTYTRSDQYNSSTVPVEYILPRTEDVGDNKTFTTNFYRWYNVSVPGFVKPTDFKAQPNQWSKSVKLTWSKETTGNRSTEGSWAIYRNDTPIAKDLDYATNEFTDVKNTNNGNEGPAYDAPYTYRIYFVPKDSPNDLSCLDELKAEQVGTVTRKWELTTFEGQLVDDGKHINLTWSHTPIAEASSSDPYQLKLERQDMSVANSTWQTIKTFNITSSDTSTGSYLDNSGLVANHTYKYQLSINLLETVYSSTIDGLRLGGSTLLNFTASRGDYNNMVKLSWSVNQSGDEDTNFKIYRRPLGSANANDWTQIYSTSGTGTNYSYDDNTVLSGTYNEYKLSIVGMDNGKETIYSSLFTDGFTYSTGVISGRITYGTGTAVKDVKVKLKKQNTDGGLGTAGMRSLRFQEPGAGMVYTATGDDVKALFDGDFSVQLYVYPVSEEMNVDGKYYYPIELSNAFGLRLVYVANRKSYRVGIGWNGGYTSTVYIPGDQWSHITITHTKSGTNMFYVTKPDNMDSRAFKNGAQPSLPASATIAIGNTGGLNDEGNFRGYIDEFRFFTKALTPDEIKQNYNHPLAGNEDGLAIYYPFDEGLKSQTIAYDYSKTNGAANGRHAKSTIAAFSSDEVPDESKLCLMNYTDSLGNYTLRGIHFQGEGTAYSVIPEYTIHKFSPSAQSCFVSSSSLVHSGVNFEDVSSFPVSGTIYYAGTTYPVEGVNLYVDGNVCSKDGEIITTAADGTYTISVPIGDHFISVGKNGHVFANNGRYPADPNGTGERVTFDSKRSNLDFIDETLVNFTGRVVGGDIEGSKPLGFGKSVNNIGAAEFVLTPLYEKPYMNAKLESETSSNYVYNNVEVPVASATSNIQSTSWRGAGSVAECKKFYIQTDPYTGEFSAMLPPLQYNVGEIKVVKTGAKVSGASTVDLSQPLLQYKDSVENDKGEYMYYEYNTQMKKAYHSEPTFNVVQEGHDDGALGESSYEVKDLQGTINVTNIYTKDDETGKVNYTHGGAIFVMKNPYTFNFEGFEEYKNYDLDDKNPVVSKVPLAETVVTIENELSSSQSVYIEGNADGAQPGTIANLQSNQLKLDSLGRATYKWKAGYPNIVYPYKRTITISYEIDNKTYLWNDGKPFYGIVLGELPTGNNFVTQGPDMIDMVLRDPPGTKSKAEWTSGTVTSYSHSRGGTWSSDTHIITKSKLGVHQNTGIGVGVVTIQNLDAKVDLTVGVDVNVVGEDATSWGRTVTATRAISTSDEMEYVGAQGDVFIGSSTNIIYGLARNVDLVRVGTSDNVDLRLQDVLTTSLGFDTEFAYTQNYIDNVLIPNLKRMRDSLLTTVTDTVGFVNKEKEPVYLTYLSPSDKKFASSNHDKEVWGNEATDAPSSGGPSYRMYIPDGSTKCYQDMVEWCINSILNWENRLRDNEKEKVEAFKYAEMARKDSLKVLNVSFDSGSAVTSTIETEDTQGTMYDCNVTSVVIVNTEMGCSINGNGVYWDVGTQTGGGEHFEDESETKKIASFSYTLQEEGDDDAISVDIYQYGQYGPIFRTRGGQTSAPYEGEVKTKYYEPKQHTIMEATMQIEVPHVTVDVAEVTDVPSGGTANYTLRLSNASEIDEDVYYRLLVADETNPDGAILSIDGKVLTDNRIIKIPAGQTVTKLLQLKQADTGILDFLGNNDEDHELYRRGIALVLASQSQCDPTSTWDVIADTVFIKAHFVPSSSPVDLVLSNTLMNTETGTDLKLTFSGFDRNYRGLKAFRLQYKKQGATDWTQFKEYVLNAADVTQNNLLLPATGANVTYTLPMTSFPDGDYLFRVVSAATYGAGEVYRYSDELALVKDTQKPRPIGTPEPADGVLDIGDDVTITFNESIVKGELFKANNFRVTGVLNGTEVDHETALSLDSGSGTAAAAQTEADINLANKDFSIDTWVNITGSGTLLSHGKGSNKLTVGTDADGKFVVNIAGNTYASDNIVPTGKWAFLTMNMSKDGIMNATVATANETVNLFTDTTVVAYAGNGPLSVGCGSKAAIHELLFWDEAHDMTVALANRSVTKNPSTRHLIGYWKMDEGEGTSIRDYSRSRNMTMPAETWYLNNKNKAVSLDGDHYVGINTSILNIFTGDDYAVEFWMRGDEQTGSAQLMQMGDVALWLNAQGELQLNGNEANLFASQQNSNLKIQTSNLLDNAWHHVALNVLRQGAAAVYVDGVRRLTTNSSNLGCINSAKMFVGARHAKEMKVTEQTVGGKIVKDTTIVDVYDRPFKGEVDEIRVWGATMTGDQLTKNRKVRLTGTEPGLIAYYPFETKTLDDFKQIVTVGIDTCLTGSHAKAEMLPLNVDPGTAVVSATPSYTDEAPALRTKPVETNVSFTYTASDEKIVINIDEDPAAIEGCTLNFTVRDVSDENGNYSDPVIWSAFVNRNELVWADDALSVTQHVETSSSVTATIVNKGGKQQMWTLDGMPSWLQASTEYGSTNPKAETQVAFTVSPATPIGKYEETIYLKGNDGIETPLTINVKVTGDEPLWAVNAADYEESMNIIGSLFVLDALSEDEDDLVGAFIDDECHGVARPVYNKRFDSYFVTMNIYGDNPKLDATGKVIDPGHIGKAITFKAYDASTGIVYPVVKPYIEDVTPSDTVFFNANDLNGRYAAPLKLTATDEVEQSIEMANGWNWTSFSVKPGTQPEDFTVERAYDKADGRIEFVKSKGKSAEYDGGLWLISGLTQMNNSEMYAVQTNEAFTLNVIGHRVDSSKEPISVNNGWSWVAFNSLSVMSLDEALAGMEPQNDEIIKGQHGVAYYDDYEWLGNLKQLTPGQGYKIQGKQARTFTYPTKTAALGARSSRPLGAQPLALSGSPAEQELPAQPHDAYAARTFTPVDYHNYPGNMVLIAQLVAGGQPVEGVELGVFASVESEESVSVKSEESVSVKSEESVVDYECREAAVSDERGMIIITIPGDKPCELTFRVSDGNSSESSGCLVPSVSITYENDAVIGTPKDPFIIDLGQTTGIEPIYDLQIDNSRFDTDTVYDLQGRKLSNSKLSNSKIHKGVYIVNGQKKVK